jgi:hypothetical protein
VCVFGEELRILCVQFVVVPFALVCTEYSLDCSERVTNFVDLFILVVFGVWTLVCLCVGNRFLCFLFVCLSSSFVSGAGLSNGGQLVYILCSGERFFYGCLWESGAKAGYKGECGIDSYIRRRHFEFVAELLAKQ